MKNMKELREEWIELFDAIIESSEGRTYVQTNKNNYEIMFNTSKGRYVVYVDARYIRGTR